MLQKPSCFLSLGTPVVSRGRVGRRRSARCPDLRRRFARPMVPVPCGGIGRKPYGWLVLAVGRNVGKVVLPWVFLERCSTYDFQMQVLVFRKNVTARSYKKSQIAGIYNTEKILNTEIEMMIAEPLLWFCGFSQLKHAHTHTQ